MRAAALRNYRELLQAAQVAGIHQDVDVERLAARARTERVPRPRRAPKQSGAPFATGRRTG